MSYKRKFLQAVGLVIGCMTIGVLFMEGIFALSRPMTTSVILDGYGIGCIWGIFLAFGIQMYRIGKSNWTSNHRS